MKQENKDILLRLLKKDKAEYIQAHIDTREREDVSIFLDRMTELHCQHPQADIDQYVKSTTEKVVDKSALRQEMVDKAHTGRETGRYFGLRGRQGGVYYRGHCAPFRLPRHHRQALPTPAHRVRLLGSPRRQQEPNVWTTLKVRNDIVITIPASR